MRMTREQTAAKMFNKMLMTMGGAILFMLATPVFGGDNAPPPGPTPDRLGGENRILAFLSTDKPIYKPGETVYARAVLLQADTYFPAKDHGRLAELAVTGPKKDSVAKISAATVDSTAGFSWVIPPGTPGGRYSATVTVDGSAPAVRQFEIRVYAPPRLKSQIEFLREGYGPGDEVTAVARVTRAEGGAPVGAKVTAIARVDGAEIARVESLTVDSDGNCRAAFALPGVMDRGEGTLAFLIEDGGVVETASKTIPILLQTLDIAFYPEGGDLVADLPGRLYIQARRPDGKPADLAGDIIRVDANGKALDGGPAATLKTAHEGRGAAAFVPQKGERYALRLNQPSGITRLFPLPPLRTSGATLRAEKATYPFGEPVSFAVHASPDSGADRITLFHREKMVAQAPLTPGENTISLDAGDTEGVLMATIWDKAGKPLAERLVFRQPKFSVRIGMTVETEPAAGSPIPGGKVRVKLIATDENGKPVEAVVGLSVTDDALLEMVEKRDQAPGLPVMVYLENEVKDLADAHVYFDPARPDAARDTDLLLGTQGWRRFVLTRLDEALKEHPDAVRRALAIVTRPKPVAYRGGDMRPDGIVAFAMPPQAAFAPRVEEMRDDMVEEWEADEGVILDMAFIPPMMPDMPPEAEPLAQGIMVAPKEKDAEAMEEPLAMGDVRMERRQKVRAPIMMPKPAPMVVIREYAHQVRANRRPNDRVDFAETLYWNAGVRTNPRDGTATVSFGLSDSVTTFKIRADAFGNNGALGEAMAELSSLEPFYIEPKMPKLAVAGDKLVVPVAMVNSTAQPLDRPSLAPRSEGLTLGVPSLPERLGAGERGRTLLAVGADKAGEYELVLNAAAAGYADAVTRAITVLPRGFPVQQAASGMVGPEKRFDKTFAIAADVAPGSMRTAAKIYPTPLANLEEALNALLRQPHGCFEQTSSTNYPLVMAQQYFTSHVGVSPDKIKQAEALLDEGYKKLIGFECPEKGYEWFGGDPGHEALTAYGLMQFIEMKKIMPVDAAMIDRTRQWLLARRDGQGGFKRNDKALDSFGAAPVPLTNIYILWTLLESGEKPDTLTAEIEAAKKLVADSKDPYILALGANVLYLAGDLPAARQAATKVQAAQDKDGGVPGAETSITRSGGDSLAIETASLAILGWLRCGDEYAGTVERAMGWLFERCKAGRFGSTQSTILALKAINAYDAARAKPKAPGTAQLIIDGKPFGNALAFDDKSRGALELPDFSAALTAGEHRVEIAMTGGGDMPFAIEIAYNTPQPANSPDCPLTLATALSARKVKEGEPLDLSVVVTTKDADVTMPLAVIGLPAGLEPRHERLKELAAAGKISSYEILGRELVLYWRALKAGDKAEVAIPLTAEIPGTYTAPASRVYAYYLDEHKHWVAGENVEITPR